MAGMVLVLSGCPQHSEVSNDEVTGEVVADFKDNTSEEYIKGVGDRLSIDFVPNSSYSSVDKIYVGHYYGNNEDEAISRLRRDVMVEAAEREVLFSIPEYFLPNNVEAVLDHSESNTSKAWPNDPRRKEQWHLDQIRMPVNWSKPNNAKIIVAIVDTGVTQTQDLMDAKIIKGYNFVENNDDSRDDQGHGTFCASVVAQSTNNGVGVSGIAYNNAVIMPVKVLGKNGSGTNGMVAEGILFAANNGAQIINLSLGGPTDSKVVADAVKYAYDKNILVIAASGNSGSERPSYPAANYGALAIGATKKDERVTFYSNYGDHLFLAAPGGSGDRNNPAGGILQNTIVNGRDDYYFMSGTSFSSPIVAGVSALIMAEGVTDPKLVKNILEKTARPPVGMEKVRPDNYKKYYGSGIVDCNAAVKMAKSINAPVYSRHSLLICVVIVGFLLLVVLLLRKKK